jgi:hypothetical protein
MKMMGMSIPANNQSDVRIDTNKHIIKLTINIKKNNKIGTVLLITTANSITRALVCYCCWSSYNLYFDFLKNSTVNQIRGKSVQITL